MQVPRFSVTSSNEKPCDCICVGTFPSISCSNVPCSWLLFFFTVNVQLFFLMPYKLQIMTRRNHLKNKLETSVCGCNIRSINLPLQECSKCHKSLSSVSRFHEIVFNTLLRLKRFLDVKSIHITIG